MAKTVKPTRNRTCFDCDHLHACQTWAGAAQLLHTDATHCANYQTRNALHWELMVARQVIDDQNTEIERLEQLNAEQAAAIARLSAMGGVTDGI